jgi:GNAT superfamily N-acetyltransferase
MIRKVLPAETDAILDVVNNAAQAYMGIIPADCWKEPYMTRRELAEEVARGVEFCGYYENGALVAVMGIQPVKSLTLIRHAYVRTDHQRRGLGEKLLRYLLGLAGTGEVLVGTWKAAWWAVRFYEKNGFVLIPQESRGKLRQYWTIPDRQAETSVVLRLDRRGNRLF